MLYLSECDQFKRDGFVFVSRRYFGTRDLEVVGDTIDSLFARWSTLPKWFAPDNGSDKLVREVLSPMLLAPVLRRSSVMQECRSLAAQLLGVEHTWCHFDHAIYKYPGGDRVSWHQDMAPARLRFNGRAVHFWIPLQDVPERAGSMLFIPGSHLSGLRKHLPQHRLSGVQLELAEGSTDDYVTKELPLGGFSIHTPFTVHFDTHTIYRTFFGSEYGRLREKGMDSSVGSGITRGNDRSGPAASDGVFPTHLSVTRRRDVVVEQDE